MDKDKSMSAKSEINTVEKHIPIFWLLFFFCSYVLEDSIDSAIAEMDGAVCTCRVHTKELSECLQIRKV